MIDELLYKHWLNINSLQQNLTINCIRWTWSWWQKRNKTSSTVQLIDTFNYLPYVPEINKGFVKVNIVVKSDRGRSQKANYDFAIEEWKKELKKYFFVTKERTIDWEREKKRKEKLSDEYREQRMKKEYKERNYNFDF